MRSLAGQIGPVGAVTWWTGAVRGAEVETAQRDTADLSQQPEHHGVRGEEEVRLVRCGEQQHEPSARAAGGIGRLSTVVVTGTRQCGPPTAPPVTHSELRGATADADESPCPPLAPPPTDRVPHPDRQDDGPTGGPSPTCSSHHPRRDPSGHPQVVVPCGGTDQQVTEDIGQRITDHLCSSTQCGRQYPVRRRCEGQVESGAPGRRAPAVRQPPGPPPRQRRPRRTRWRRPVPPAPAGPARP